jgi:pimeloyl-ACP methyl ester carboxylesterase
MRVLTEGVVDRTVVLFGVDADPDPELTWARGITLLACTAGEVPPPPPGPVAVVGWSGAGMDALAFAARHPAGLVDRIVLVATPKPDDESLPFGIADVRAKSLLLFGSKDPLAGAGHGRWWQRQLPDARLEVYPDGTHDLLGPAWPRALSHLAPRCRRGGHPPSGVPGGGVR